MAVTFLIAPMRGEWGGAKCGIKDCEAEPQIGFSVERSLQSQALRPKIPGRTFTSAIFASCVVHEPTMRGYLRSKGFTNESVGVISYEQIQASIRGEEQRAEFRRTKELERQNTRGWRLERRY